MWIRERGLCCLKRKKTGVRQGVRAEHRREGGGGKKILIEK